MKKLLLLSAIALLPGLSALASGQWTLQNKTYKVDTVFHANIGPGTTQTSLSLTGASKLNIFYTTTDLTHPYVDIRVAQAGSRLTGGAKLSTMSNANTNATTGIEYFAGVNADFFGNSQPIGSTVVDGSVYKAVSSDWISFYMNDSKKPGIELLQFKGTCTGPTSSHAVSAINSPRYENYLVIYNTHYAANTGTNIYGTEVKIVPTEGSIGYNGKVKCRVSGTPTYGVGSMTIPTDGFILSGNGTASTFVQSLKDGDEITLDLSTELATGGTVTQMAGGQPIILQNGVTLNTQNALDHLTALNPRTAVGYNADRTKLVLLVVDGRGASAGVVSKVLADIMREVGCSDAMNFDGGGSSELYTRAFGVRNRPSDGQERTVVNSVWAVATAPADNTLAKIQFLNPTIVLPKYGYYKPTFYGYNQYDVLKSTDLKGVQLSCDPALGEIIDGGTTLYANGSGTHPLTATYSNGVTATVMVTIGSAAPEMRLSSVLIDPHHPYTAEVTSTAGDEVMTIDNKALTWTSDDPGIATVDDLGVISGVKAGSTVVRATVDSFAGSLPVTVDVPGRRYLNIDREGDLSKWSVTKTSMSSAELSKPEGVADGGMAVTYKVSSTRGTKVTLKLPVDLCGVPDSIRMVINPGDANVTKIDLSFAPKGERADVVSLTPTLEANKDNVVLCGTDKFCDPKDFKSYPLEMTSIAFYVGDAVGSTHTITIPALQTVHTGYAADDAVIDIVADKAADNALIANGIVTRGELIALAVDESATWTVCNTAGCIVARGKGNVLDSALLNPGLYIVSAGGKASRLVVRQ